MHLQNGNRNRTLALSQRRLLNSLGYHLTHLGNFVVEHHMLCITLHHFYCSFAFYVISYHYTYVIILDSGWSICTYYILYHYVYLSYLWGIRDVSYIHFDFVVFIRRFFFLLSVRKLWVLTLYIYIFFVLIKSIFFFFETEIY